MVKGAARSGDNSMLIHWLRFSNTVAGGYSFVPVPDPPVSDVVKGFVTPQLSRFPLFGQLPLIVVGAHVAQVRMQPAAVIKHGNVFQDVLLRPVA